MPAACIRASYPPPSAASPYPKRVPAAGDPTLRGAPMIRASARSRLSALFEEPAARFLAGLGVSADAITLGGLLVAGVSAYLVSVGLLLAGGLTLLGSGTFDLLDGAVARQTGKVTKFGGLLDSVADRVAESGLLLGVLVFYIDQSYAVGIVLAYVALAVSFLVSYVRARAEGLGVSFKGGVMTRAERVASLAVGLIVAQWWLPALAIVLGVVAGLGLVTSVHRVLYSRRSL